MRPWGQSEKSLQKSRQGTILEQACARTRAEAEEWVVPGRARPLRSPIQAETWQPVARASWHHILFASIRQEESAEDQKHLFRGRGRLDFEPRPWLAGGRARRVCVYSRELPVPT